MGKPPLPAPTESSVTANDNEVTTDSDIATDLTQRTDRTHYSIPEDGREVTLPTKKIRTQKTVKPGGNSHTSLLIEYFEAGRAHDTAHGRPSVRVQVTPSAKKVGKAEDFEVTQNATTRKPSYTRRISFGNKSKAPPVSFNHPGEGSNVSERSPIEVEIMGNQSELSELPPESNVSSMPGDSIIDGPADIKEIKKELERPRSRSPVRTEPKITIEEDAATSKLKAPDIGRSRSKSTERITRKALEKIQREHSPEPEKSRRLQKSRPQSSGSELVEESTLAKGRSRRSSKSHHDSSDLRSATESSLLPPRDNESNLSAGSKVSLTNPRLIATVEDAIKRLILPEIETIKRNQSVRSTQTRDSFTTDGTVSRSGTGRRLSKSTSEPYVKGGHHDDTESRDGDRRRRKHKKSSREPDSETASSRRDSIDSVAAEKEKIRKSKESSRRRDGRGAESSLTRANLKSHTSHSSVEGHDREKRKHRSKSKSRTNSIAETEDEYYKRSEIPPLPMTSAIQDSELTRTSLLSAETVESEDVRSSTDRTVEQPGKSNSHDISVTSPSTPKTPREARSKDSVGLKSSRSDRSISSKSRAQRVAVGLGGAAGGLYGLKGTHNTSRPSSRRSSTEKRGGSRDQSPARASRKASKETPQATIVTEAEPVIVERAKPVQEPSKESISTTSSTNFPVTYKRELSDKRHTGLYYEDPEMIGNAEGERFDDQDDTEKFYEDQHELNNQYRNSFEEEFQRDSGAWSKSFEARDSIENASFGQAAMGQTIKGIGASPQVVNTSHQPESAVASLINQSMVSEQSQPSAAGQHELHHKDDVDRLDETREIQAQQEEEDHSLWLQEHDNTSAERWNQLRGHAQQISHSASSQGSASPVKRDLQEPQIKEQITVGTSAVPAQDDEMPEIGYGHDVESELTDHGSMKRPDSIVEGPLGDEYEARGLWPYEPTPDLERRGGYVHPDERDSRSIDSGVANALGAAAGAGLGIGATEGSQSAKNSQPSQQSLRDVPHTQDRQYLGPSPNAHKDEGYISAAHPRSPSVGSPLSFSKPPPQLFDERDAGRYDQAAVGQTPEDPFVGQDTKQSRHLSANSHGIPAEAYDAATGEGINHIQSKDVVALMDHLTVRDAHRNARDTEILVTLVRSAAEMRNNIDELKNFVDMQGQVTRRHNTSESSQLVSKILNGTRAAALSNSGPSKLSRFSSPTTEKEETTPPKKKNIFKRALSGLGTKNEKDISKIEDMLMQLLEDVESLKDVQASSLAGGSQRQMLPQQSSLDSYERLRAAPESGYEPDGQAGTGSTPNVSGTFSPSGRPGSHRMHSGYNVTRDSTNRISTVLEHPEENTQNGGYENDDGMITPTQEAQQQRVGFVPPAEYVTPPTGHTRGVSSGGKSQFNPYASPRTSDSKTRQHSVSSSMFGGVPRISRWSKTTASSAPGRDSYQRDRPYSEASRSGSDVNVLPRGEGEVPYEPHDDDRIRSANSLTKELKPQQQHHTGRSPSPLLPQDEAPIDDPKYHANRHSLTLEHPQPRQGSTQRHQTHLESQAYSYPGQGHQRPMSDRSSDRGSPTSPNADVFGSAPTLAKNRFSTRSARTSSGEYGTPNSTGSGGYRVPPARTKDDGPLVPQPQPSQQTPKQTQGGRRDSLDTLSDHDSYEDSLSQGSYRRHDSGARGQPADTRSYEEDDYSSEGDSVPENTRGGDWEADSEDASDHEGHEYYPVPLDRPRSPYYPGAQLTTIEERYSLEQSRISSPLSRHQSVKSKDMGEKIDELDEGSSTPTQSPIKAIDSPQTPGSGGARKVTPQGPRAMPGGVPRRVRS